MKEGEKSLKKGVDASNGEINISSQNGTLTESLTRNGSVKGHAGSQPTIISMFAAASRKSDVCRTSDPDGIESSSVKKGTNSPSSKKRKLNENRMKPSDGKPDFAEWKKCHVCRQIISDKIVYEGHPEGAIEEAVALLDDRLSLFTGDEEAINEDDQRPTQKLTSFSVYDGEGHLCPFDEGLIERNVLLYVSGYMKPIYDENPSIEDGVSSKDIGPINEWWMSGFDGGENAIIGLSTAFADYVLMEPSEAFAHFYIAVKEKIQMGKIVIEYLVNTPEAEYEDLLHQVATAVPPSGLGSFSEETLLRHAQFICDQVHSFDMAGDVVEDEPLTQSPCIKYLISLAGVILGKRRALKRRDRIKVTKMPRLSKPTTTPLIRGLFETIFPDQLADGEKTNIPRRARCGVCEECMESDCGDCRACKDMTKFGGSGRSKQCCVRRRCPNLSLVDRESDEDLEELPEVKHPRPKPKHSAIHNSADLKWIGQPISKTELGQGYLKASVGTEVVLIGDCVAIQPQDPEELPSLARVVLMWEDKRGAKFFHADFFCRGSATILGETSDPKELFLDDQCEDVFLGAILKKVSVMQHHLPSDWQTRGGVADPEVESPISSCDENTFFYQKFWNSQFARFEDLDVLPDTPKYKNCPSCYRTEMCEISAKARLGPTLQQESLSSQICFQSVEFGGYSYAIGDCAFVDPETFCFPKTHSRPATECVTKKVDENVYPEYYRKNADRIKGSNADTSDPFRVVRILQILAKNSTVESGASPEDIKIKIAKFYRPENTHKGIEASYQLDLNLLYWSNEETTITLDSIRGKCWVVYKYNLTKSVDEYAADGPYRFYFSEAYNAKAKTFEHLPGAALSYGGIGKGKGKGKCSGNTTKKSSDIEMYPQAPRKLRSLDVFAGCGGLSLGLRQSGVCESSWAIEMFEPAAQAFKLNNPHATVFIGDCNHILKLVMEGKETDANGQKLPQKGDVELLCGGPPCQGFSGMNRFDSRERSRFKNSLVASYLSYCDYYRPKYFILENVRNFVSYKCSVVLKVTLRALLSIGYQCAVGVLQAGNFGVPQTRRRTFILAAAPEQKLPFYPQPLTTFSKKGGTLAIVVDKERYVTNCRWISSAPFRTTTVRDALSDLPALRNGAKKDQISYGSDPETHFQRLIRGSASQPLLRDHICKEMSPLVVQRMMRVPKTDGSDWRDLPNIAVQLSDGSYTNVLFYTYHDKKTGKSSSGAFRGVCICATGKPCDPERQDRTLIPWCLAHRANKHNHYAGLYGRLNWDGYFSTTITDPEPMGKQGRVLHPEQDRVISVRECARSQGFPDTYRIYGTIKEKHCQIGNAVPPPMGRAIGFQIVKSLHLKEKEAERLGSRLKPSESESTDALPRLGSHQKPSESESTATPQETSDAGSSLF